MNEPRNSTLRAWIEREFNMAGVLAAGGAAPGLPAFAAFVSNELGAAREPFVWQSVGEGIASLRETRAPVGELLWGFERAVLCTVQRDDGTWLGVFTSPDLDDQSAIALRAKLDAFKQQPFEREQA